METVAVKPMEALFTNAGTVISNLVNMLGTVSTALLSNSIFQIVIGIVLFNIVMGIVYSLVRKLRKRGK